MDDRSLLSALYERRFSRRPDGIVPIRGDGSDRLIFRLQGPERSAVGIIGDNLPENRAFIGFTRAFRALGLPAPELYEVSDDERCYLEEDLGDTNLSDWQLARRAGSGFPPEAEAMYERVLSDLVRFQVDAAEAVDYTLCYQYPEFGREAMFFDVRYFREMFLGQLFAGMVDDERYDAETSALVDRLLTADRRFFLYRDFQSRNVMISNGEPRYIDYQSGRRGALHYDVACLLYDSKGKLPEAVREQLLDAYLGEVEKRIPLDRGEFRRLFFGFAVLRVMQALGAFGNLGLRKGKRHFLELVPSRLGSLRSLLPFAEVLRPLEYLTRLFRRLTDDPDAVRIPKEGSDAAH